jgi:hypothetical protein
MNYPEITPEMTAQWDWEKGKRTVVASLAPAKGCAWQEEPRVSPDGEHFAAVLRLEDDSMTVRVDDDRWDVNFEKAWFPRYAPDGRLTCLVMADDEWTVAVDGEPWEERFSFAWGTRFGKRGQIYVSIQQDMRYGFAKDGEPWEELFENATEFSLRGDGKKSAAVVQVRSLKQADLAGFRSGVFSLAVDGQRAWDDAYMNLWTPVFDGRGGERVACQARLTAFDYTIVVNNEPWPAVFACVWEPAFDPATGALAAPVRQSGRWGMAVDGAMFWPARYFQCWQQQWSRDGKHLWAIGAPEYGKFTVLRDDKAWPCAYPVVSDLVLSPQGDRAAALACHANTDYLVLVDGKAWQGPWDMAWKPVFSPDGRNVAVLVRNGAKNHSYLVNNLPVGESFSLAWPPLFSPDSRKVLLRGVQNNALVRLVMQIDDIF